MIKRHQVGDRVKFNENGPVMTVKEILKRFDVNSDKVLSDRFVRCEWFEDGRLRSFTFKEDELIGNNPLFKFKRNGDSSLGFNGELQYN